MLSTRHLALILTAFLVTGCSGTKQVPREEFEAVSRQPLSFHQIFMADGSSYKFRKFSVTDSTLVIRELSKSDERYGKADLPIILPLADVESMETKDARETGFLFFATTALLVFIAGMFAAGIVP
jgi:hypothetical protein